jgi:hypothetical protein
MGKSRLIPNNITIIAEIACQANCGTPRRIVEAFKSRLNVKTDRARLKQITIACFRLLPSFSSADSEEPPIIIGSRGNMHGASTVSAPATNESIIKPILIII